MRSATPGILKTLGTSDWVLLVVPGVIWGASFLFIAEGLRALGPNGVTFVRILVGFATLSLFPAARGPVAREDRARIAGLGLLWFALPLSLFPFAEQRVTSALTGMLNGANPIFTALVAALLTRRAPTRGVGVGLIVGLLGAVLVALPSIGEGASSASGVAMILLALTFYGFALNLARPLQQRNGALPVLWRAQGVALLATAPLGLPELLRAHWSLGPVLSLLALGSLGTGLAFVITAVAAGRLGATRASATAYFIPVVALVLGVLVRGEQVAALSVAGSVVLLAGAWVMRRASERAQSTPIRPASTALPADTRAAS
jgi:drug/metabolite transporter (DMT)-like permease